ncbi:hypothetical protein MKX03_015374, partial [Papaver bracteatum]
MWEPSKPDPDAINPKKTAPADEFIIPDRFILMSNNYQSWKDFMVGSLEWYYQWKYHPVLSDVNRIDLRKEKKVLEPIKRSCSAEMLPHIMYAVLAREAWEWLAQADAWTYTEK